MSDENIASFVAITCASTQEARQYLEAANGNLQQAIDLFYQKPNGLPPPPQRPNPRTQQPPRTHPPPHQPPQEKKNYIEDIFTHAQNQQTAPEEQFDSGDKKVEKVKVTFWKNGFQVNDGDFRSNEDPANQNFLESVSRGMIPRELYKPGIEIDLELDDNREKDYKPKPKPFNPFGGASHNLSSGKPSQPAAAPPAQAQTNFATAGKPATKVRIQLSDQTLILSVNTTATVGDLRNYILQNRPDLRGKRFKLDVAMPPQALTDDSVTIEAAKLKMAQIILTVL